MQFLILQARRNLSGGNAQCNAFGNSGFTHAGFTDQTGTAQSEHGRINSNVSVGHRWKDSGGNEVWTDIEMEIVFLDAHTYA